MSNLEIRCVNPLEHSGQIKDLFLANERPEFPEFFDRAFPSAVTAGGRSWIGIDDGGHVALHVARFPHRFAWRERTVVGGLLVTLMAAKTHRTVVPALTLVRHVNEDSRADGKIDFLYADPNAVGGAVLKAVGYSVVGNFQRFAFPLAGSRWYTDVLTRAYLEMVAIRARYRRVKAVQHSAQRFDAQMFERPLGDGPALRPFRPPELYEQRLVGFPSTSDYWLTFHEARSTRPCAAVLVRGAADSKAVAYSISRVPSVPLSAIVAGVARELRSAGYHRLYVSTLMETHFARELTRAGFVPRPETTPLLACALTPLGAEALRSAKDWEITDLDCDR